MGSVSVLFGNGEGEMKRIKESVILMLLGLSGMVFGMASDYLNMIEKVSVTIFCFCVMLFGILIKSGVLNTLKEGEEKEEDFSNDF